MPGEVSFSLFSCSLDKKKKGNEWAQRLQEEIGKKKKKIGYMMNDAGVYGIIEFF